MSGSFAPSASNWPLWRLPVRTNASTTSAKTIGGDGELKFNFVNLDMFLFACTLLVSFDKGSLEPPMRRPRAGTDVSAIVSSSCCCWSLIRRLAAVNVSLLLLVAAVVLSSSGGGTLCDILLIVLPISHLPHEPPTARLVLVIIRLLVNLELPSRCCDCCRSTAASWL